MLLENIIERYSERIKGRATKTDMQVMAVHCESIEDLRKLALHFDAVKFNILSYLNFKFYKPTKEELVYRDIKEKLEVKLLASYLNDEYTKSYFLLDVELPGGIIKELKVSFNKASIIVSKLTYEQNPSDHRPIYKKFEYNGNSANNVLNAIDEIIKLNKGEII